MFVLTVFQEDVHGQVPVGDNHWHGTRYLNREWMNYMKGSPLGKWNTALHTFHTTTNTQSCYGN